MSITNERPTRASAAKEARERARVNRVKLDAERADRDAKIEENAEEFFKLAFEASELREKLEEVDERRGAAVRAIRELGEKDTYIAGLLEIDAREIGRLAKLGTK